MTIYLNKDVVFTTTNQKQNSSLRLCLIDKSLWIGNIYNGYDIENKISVSYGNFPFLWDGGTTFLFDKETSMFTCLMLNFPVNTIKPTNIDIKFTSISKGSILYNNKENFYFPSPEGMYYDSKNDKLIFYLEKSFFSYDEYNTVELVNDFELIIDKSKTIVGGILNNPLRYLDIDISSIELFRYLFNQAIIMIDDKNIEKMEERDENMRKRLIELSSNSKNNTLFFTFFQDLLKEYY